MTVSCKIFIGYDSREDIAWQVCRQSILRHAPRDTSVFPLKQATLREIGLYTRNADHGSATEFSLTRFLTPYIAAHDSWSIFVDCDFLFTTDIRTVLEGLDPAKAVHVVQHDYTPSQERKMDGRPQSVYPRKNWSSFIVFNGCNEHVKALTPAVVNTALPAYLHRFSWLPDDLIGALPLAWNFLVGEYPKAAHVPSAIHFTNGGPWFDNCRDVDYAELWRAEHEALVQAVAAE
jgi:hypothetical protein